MNDLGEQCRIAPGAGHRALHEKRSAERARYRQAIAARADQQHNWVLRRDDRGIYGVEGAELMHYLYPERGRIRKLNRRR
jgi:hypothetical protein